MKKQEIIERLERIMNDVKDKKKEGLSHYDYPFLLGCMEEAIEFILRNKDKQLKDYVYYMED